MARPGSRPIDELIRLAMIGDGAAFTELWDTHIESLRSYIRGWMKTLDDFYVDDICSKSFEKAFRQIRSYDPSRSQFFTWLRTIAKNTAIDTVEQENRLQRKYVSLDDDSKPGSMIDIIRDDIDTPLESIIKDEDEEKEGGSILPEFVTGESGPHEPSLLDKWTQPPKLYNEAALIRAMETAGNEASQFF